MNEIPEQIKYRNPVKSTGWATVYHAITLDDRISNGAYRLLMLYEMHAQQKEACWPGRERLAKMLKCSEPTISRYNSELENAGYITRQRRMGTSSLTIIEDYEQIPYLQEISKDMLARRITDDTTVGSSMIQSSDHTWHVKNEQVQEEQENNEQVITPDGEKSESEILSDDVIEWSTPTTPAQQPTKEERLKSLQAIAGRDVGEGVIRAHENAAPDEWVTVADAYCACILGVRLSDMPESNQHNWPRKLKTIAENIGASSAQMIEALRVMPEKYSGVAFKIPGAYSSPYAGAFEPDVTMVIAKIAAGQLTARGSPVIEMRGRSQ